MNSNTKEKEQLKKFYLDQEQRKTNDTQTKNQRWINKLKKTKFTTTPEEKRLYKKFCQLAKADPDQKFKLSHIEDLGVEADVVICYGKKSIGKTRQISSLIANLSYNDPEAEIILVRNTVSEFQALQRQLDAEYWPVFLKGTGNNPLIYHKYLERDGKPRYMGFCVGLNGISLEAAKSAEYPNVRYIIWDECTNTGAGNKYDSGDIARFVTFLDSIIRSKKNVKVYIFGNFHRNTDGKVSDILLDLFHIPYGCKLKIIESKSADNKSKSKLLYINTGKLYSGIDANSKISLFGAQLEEDLLTNEPQSDCPKVGGLSVFYSHTPMWGLLFSEGEKIYLLLLSKFFERSEERLIQKFMLHAEEIPTNNKFIHPLYTVDAGLFNQYNHLNLNIVTAEEWWFFMHDLYEISLSLDLSYSGDETRYLLNPIFAKWQTKYNLGISSCFRKKNRYNAQGL